MTNFIKALPFWVSLLLIPIVWLCVIYGGWMVIFLPFASWVLFGIIDVFAGLNTANKDPNTPDSQLFWYRLITLIWPPLQFMTLFGAIYYITHIGHLGMWEVIGTAVGLGVITGTIGINYSHELMHQKSRLERWLADILLAMVMYSHFRTEHLLVHHPYVGTPRDPVTARYNEGFHHFFWRVLWQCYRSALRAERGMLARKGVGFWHFSNPFWRYWALQGMMIILALVIGGWVGLAVFFLQAFTGVFQLELINYIEHYGLTRRHLGGGKYEPVGPHHSWNSAHMVTNWLLINLQRHSDHHYKPARRFPLLQTYGDDQAPQLPQGSMTMTLMALIPPLWRRRMNPRVRAWRKRYYPDISDWTPYKTGTNPMPR